jgi:hypothetical protein
MREARILTIAWDASTGIFDDSILREYLTEREILVSEPHFFVHAGQPYWTVYIETRPLQGSTAKSWQRKELSGDLNSESDRAYEKLLSELDENERARYQRILQWRREASRREGVPHYVLCTNRQALDLARRAPKSLQAIAEIRGFGHKKIQKHGKEILEVLHGRIPDTCSRKTDTVREMDRDHEMADVKDRTFPEEDKAQPDKPDREHSTGNSGINHISVIPEEQDADS